MTVTCLKQTSRKYQELYLTCGYLGPVYPSDIRKYGLEEGADIPEDDISELTDTIRRRAFNKAVKLISAREYCTADIVAKLKQKGYSADTSEYVTARLYDYGYLNDERFAFSYIMTYMSKKSRRMIERELCMKGISQETYERAADEAYAEYTADDEDIIKNILEKRYKDADFSDERVKRRVYAYMSRRGFSVSTVNKYLT